MFEFIVFTFLYQTNYNTIREYDVKIGTQCPFNFKIMQKERLRTKYDGTLKRKQKVLIAISCRTKNEIINGEK
tara:strand:+ start:571 stop:789 length:219 start_codon:yes stop_codon:yes gene_type:complete